MFLKSNKSIKDISPRQNVLAEETVAPFQKQATKEFKDEGGEREMYLIKRRTRKKIGEIQPKKNYFHNMYKESKKKTNINVFVRKMKQSAVLKTVPEELSNLQDKDTYLLKTIKWKNWAQVSYKIIFVFHAFVMSLITSLCLSFPQIRESPEIKVSSLITVILSLADIVINFTTRSSINMNYSDNESYFLRNKGLLYLKRYFFVDALIALIFFADLFAQGEAISFLKVIIFVKIYWSLQKINILEIYFLQNLFREQYWELAKLLFWNFFFAHFISCTLMLMSSKEDQNWLTTNHIDTLPWYEQYLWSYYWATTIMLTIGFGDLTPTNSKQIIFIIFIETFSCIVLAYSINNVGNIIKKITSYEEEKVKNLKIFTNMEQKEQISDDIKGKIKNYIIKSAELKRRFNVEEEKQLLNKLPKTFNDQYKKQSIVKIFSGVKFFRNLSMMKLSQIALKVEKKLAHSQEILLVSNQVPEIVIANKGHLAITMNRIGLAAHGRQVQDIVVGENQYKLLSQYFFTNKVLKYDIKCKDFTIIYILKKEDLIAILNTNPYYYEYFCMERDKNYYNPGEMEIIPCTICKGITHHTLCDCPNLHYIPIKSHVITKNQKQKNHIDIGEFLKYAVRLKMQHKSTSCLKQFKKNKDIYCYQILNQKHIDIEEEITRSALKDKLMKRREQSKNKKGLREPYIQRCSRNQRAQNTYKMNSVKEICKKFGEQIKDQVMKIKITAGGGFTWDLECDTIQDFKFYFQKDNPAKLYEKFKKK